MSDDIDQQQVADPQAGGPTAVPLPPRAQALIRAVVETEAHVALEGWDAPARVFALVRTAAALAIDPDLAELLDQETLDLARTDPELLTVVEQEDLPAAGDLEELLDQIAWPDSVDGAVISAERVMLPPAAQQEAEAIDDPHELQAFLASRSDREDIRIVVGVLRSGESWCALRSRSHDSPGEVYQGTLLVPGLVEALGATFL
ncbi:PPA1309 family protein [Actinomyces bowdenii]|uniref:PPA1309 family protein n=1 Tax=Actinomyces bowdenii TaxID=131109 RepID=UPI001D16B9CE|nr:PPA1309 family protein [Actinomyces bowdenii]